MAISCREAWAGPTLVTRNTSLRRPSNASPTSSSAAPSPYISPVSTRVMPRSSPSWSAATSASQCSESSPRPAVPCPSTGIDSPSGSSSLRMVVADMRPPFSGGNTRPAFGSVPQGKRFHPRGRWPRRGRVDQLWRAGRSVAIPGTTQRSIGLVEPLLEQLRVQVVLTGLLVPGNHQRPIAPDRRQPAEARHSEAAAGFSGGGEHFQFPRAGAGVSPARVALAEADDRELVDEALLQPLRQVGGARLRVLDAELVLVLHRRPHHQTAVHEEMKVGEGCPIDLEPFPTARSRRGRATARASDPTGFTRA